MSLKDTYMYSIANVLHGASVRVQEMYLQGEWAASSLTTASFKSLGSWPTAEKNATTWMMGNRIENIKPLQHETRISLSFFVILKRGMPITLAL